MLSIATEDIDVQWLISNALVLKRQFKSPGDSIAGILVADSLSRLTRYTKCDLNYIYYINWLMFIPPFYPI